MKYPDKNLCFKRVRRIAKSDLYLQVAHRMANAAEALLREKLPRNVEIRIDCIKEHPDKAVGVGSGIVWVDGVIYGPISSSH